MSRFAKTHRAPWKCLFAENDNNKCLPGKPPKNDNQYFEILALCIFQSGLGWGMIRKIWPKMRNCFYEFRVEKIINIKAEEILKNPGIIKNERKIKAILKNAKRFQEIQEKHGSFRKFITSLKELREKEAIGKLTEEFEYFGKYSAEYFLHSIGFWKKN